MTALDLLTVLCGVLALGARRRPGAWCRARLLRAARALEAATEAFERGDAGRRASCAPRSRRATGEVDRIDDLLEVAGSIGERVDTATEATYRALTSPVIKGVALASGTRRAAQRLRAARRRASGRDRARPTGSERS